MTTENIPNQAMRPPTPKEEILRGVELSQNIDAEALTYDERYGGLVLPQEGGSSRILMFRAHADPSIEREPRPAPTRKPLIPKVNDTFYGTGLYLGNTPQAVSLYSWREGSKVSAFLTPAVRPEEVADQRGAPEQSVTAARRLGHHAVKSVTMRLAKDRVVGSIDRSYGDSKVAIQDMGPDAFAMQRYLAEPHAHPVKPAWFVWRGEPAQLESVGRVAAPVAQRAIGKMLLKK